MEENVKRKIVNVASDRLIKTSYGVRWNGYEKPFHGLQGSQAIEVENKMSPVDAKFASRPTKIIRQTKSNQPQGMSAQATTEKDFSVVASNPHTKALIIKDHNSEQYRAFDSDGKIGVIPSARTSSKTNIVFDDVRIEVLTWIELERLMGLPDSYTDLGEFDNRVEPRGRAIGNGFQCDIVAHLLSFMLSRPEPLKRSISRLFGEQQNLFE